MDMHKSAIRSCIVELMLQKRFGAIFLVGIVLMVFTVGFFILKSVTKNFSRDSESQHTVSLDAPPLKLKSIGVNFEDFKFTKEKLEFNRLFMGFGFVIPASPDYKEKSNPQPTFILPLGTPVRSLVDGVVAALPTLWSGDISIQVTENGKMEKWIYETEHVRNPKVRVGDQVKAGQIIAEVGSFGNGEPQGFGSVEIGILKGGNPPQHICPFAYLDDSIKEDTFTKLRNLFKSWEEYIGNMGIYDESLPVPGCLTLDPIEG